MKVAFYTLGCKVNHYETQAMEELFKNAGYEITPFEEAADIYVVNTCTVTQISDKKSRQMLSRAHTQNPDAMVVAVGCYAETARETVPFIKTYNKPWDLVWVRVSLTKTLANGDFGDARKFLRACLLQGSYLVR